MFVAVYININPININKTHAIISGEINGDGVVISGSFVAINTIDIVPINNETLPTTAITY